MASFTGKGQQDYYKDILHTSNSNTGIANTLKQITCGDGDTTAFHLSARNVKVQPNADTTTNTVIYDKDVNALLTVDSTNDLVKAGIGQHTANTQYAYFGVANDTSTYATGTHYALPFQTVGYISGISAMGTGTNPDSSLTISSTANSVVGTYWYVMDNITIDRVVWFSGADNATGDTTRVHLMSYSVDTGNSSTGGDLSSGAVLADGGDITNAGNEQIYYQQLSIGTANVDAGKIILFTFRLDAVAGTDYTINATVKYHLR